MLFVVLVVGTFSTCLSVYPSGNVQYLDMTYIINDKIPFWPSADPYTVTNLWKGPAGPDIDWLYLNKFEMEEHYGTHIDAPIHFYEHGWAVDEIPFNHLHGPAVRIDISKRAARNSDATVEVSDILKWEEDNGCMIPDGAIVFMFSGWGKFWNQKVKFQGGDNASELHFPGFSTEVAEWFVKYRPKINGLGVDTLSCDTGTSQIFQVHQTMYRENIFCLENVAHLDKLPENGATVFALPLNLEGGSGSSTRIFAVWEDQKKQ